MKAEILKLAGVNNDADFYKKFPTEKAFIAKYGKQLEKLKKAQNGLNQGFSQIQMPKVPSNGLDKLQNYPANKRSTLDIGMSHDRSKKFNLGKVDLEGLVSQGAGALGSIIGAIDQIGENKKDLAYTKMYGDVSDVVMQAQSSRPEAISRKYVRPEDSMVNGMNPFGTGTNYLAAENGAEIQNTYAPNYLYNDLGYEPLDDSEYEQYEKGGQLKKAAAGFNFDQFSGIGGELGGRLGSAITGGSGKGGPGATIGSSIGGLASFIPGIGPIAGLAGSAIGGLIGGLFDGGSQKEQKAAQDRFDNNMNNVNLQTGVNKFQQNNSGFMEDGGQMAMGGDLEVYRGKAETMSYNPFLPNNGETIMFRGPSHDNGGMPVSYGNNGVEVEGGEPAMVMKNGGKQDNLVVFGNMIIPDYGANEIGDNEAKGKKFKHYIADLSKQEAKYNKTMDKSIKLVNDSDTHNPFDQLSFNSGRAMLKGSQMYLKDIAGKKLNTSAVQNAILDTAEEYELDSAKLAQQSVAKFGGKFSFNDIAQNGTKKGKGKPVTNVSKKSNSLPTIKPYKETNTLQSFVKNIPFAERKAMGENIGIPNFKGTVEQNQFLFNKTQQSDRAPLRGPFDYTNSLEKIPVTALNKAISAGDYGNNNPSYSGYPNPEKENSNIPWEAIAQSAMSNIYPFIRPTSARPLDPSQLSPEMLAASMNQQQSVAAQLYNPMLTQATSISLQDQLNEVTAQSRSAERMAAYNPEAASMIFAQVSDAKNKILGEQFRMNQAENQRVSQQNANVLNDAQLKNLALLDQQYVRQSQAESNTKQQSMAIANSIASKIAQNKLENRQVTTMENMYPDFSFTGSGRAYKNPLTRASFNFDGDSQKNERNTDNMTPTYEADDSGNPQSSGYKNKKKSTTQARNGSIVKAFKNF